MDKLAIFNIIKGETLNVLSHIDEESVTEAASLRELGANSIDRAEIIMMALEKLNLRMPMIEFAKARNISDICALIENKLLEKG